VGTLLAEETNRSLRVLSVISIMFMPPTFIGGLFGMNLHGIPFSDWPAGFWAATAVSLVSSALVVWGLSRAGILGTRRLD
jgi:Mg2+ and Co2+ transporter CorA